MDEPSARRKFWCGNHWALLPILLFATLLRAWQINESLWLDELHSAWVVSGNMGDVSERAQMGNQSPLYFYLLWATTSLFGMSEWALRLPSLVAGVSLIALAYELVRQFTHSRIAAVASSLLASLDHNFLFYATEARPYAFVQLFAAVQFFIFWRLQAASTGRRRLAFVASTAVLFYLHYTAILLVAGEAVFLLTRSLVRRSSDATHRYRFHQLVIDMFCVLVTTTPAAADLLNIGARRQAWASFVNDSSLRPTHWFSLFSYVVVPVFVCLMLGIGKVVMMHRDDEPITLDKILGKPSSSTSRYMPSSSPTRSLTATVYLLCCWFLVPLVMVWLLTVADIARLYLGRYVIGVALAPVLLCGVCIGVWRSRITQTVIVGLVVSQVVYASGMIGQWRYDGRLFGDRAENWRDAVRHVNESRLDGPVYVRSGFLEADRLAPDASELLRDYCVSPVTSIYRIERPIHEIRPLPTHNPGRLTNNDVARVKASGGAWFIVNGSVNTSERCAQQVLASLAKEIQHDTDAEPRRARVIDERRFGRVGVFFVFLSTDDDHLNRRDDQPTSPNSIAPP